MSSPRQSTVLKQIVRSLKPARTLPGLFAIFSVLLLLCSEGHAIRVEYTETKTVSLDRWGLAPGGPIPTLDDWYATSYDIGNINEVTNFCAKNPDDCKDQDGKRPATKLCFWRDPAKKMAWCHSIMDAGPGYVYETTENLKAEFLCDKGCPNGIGLVLDARNRSFTVGWIGSLSCWVYDRKLKDFVNILPSVRFTEQGEYRIFRSLGSGIRGVIVEADAEVNWKDGETRYSAHRFLISIYKQNAKGHYEEIGHYRTRDKYQSLDDLEEIDVIIPELDKIKRLILSKQKRPKK